MNCWRDRLWLLALAVLLAGVAILSGCGESVTEPLVPPLTSRLTAASDGQIQWTTSLTTRGTVRYGFVSGQYDRVAYPAAGAGRDKVYDETHTVILLSAVAGVPIYIQRTDQTNRGHFYAAAEETVVFASVPDLSPLLVFTSLDVQFGDAHVLELPSEGKLVMIDAGPWYEERRGESAVEHVLHWLEGQAVERIDYALATHTHADHWGGFLPSWSGSPGVFALYEIGIFLDVAEVSGNHDDHEEIVAYVDAKGITRYVIEPGMSNTTDPEPLGWDPLVDVLVLNAGSQPEWAGSGWEGDRINNDSIVLKISYGEVDIITGGDCENPGEARILTHYPAALGGVEYYKAHHHGRYDASSEVFVQAIAPRVAFIPVAFAAYNEGPAGGADATAQTLERLAAVGADVFRFDSAAPVGHENDNRTFWHTSFVTDGTSYEVRIAASVWGLR